jgi:hypothetical protein
VVGAGVDLDLVGLAGGLELLFDLNALAGDARVVAAVDRQDGGIGLAQAVANPALVP